MRDSNVFGNKFTVEFDETERALLIFGSEDSRQDAVKIRWDVLSSASIADASQFIGERLILRIPALRDLYKDYLWTDEGRTPPRKQLGEGPG